MRLTLLFTLLSFFTAINFSQKDYSPVGIHAYDTVEVKPEFPGGDDAFYSYICSHLNYPVRARDKKISGSVYVEFIIDTTGKVVDAKVISNTHPYLEYAVLQIIKSMPNWTPGKHNDKKVPVVSVIPINFVLSADFMQN